MAAVLGAVPDFALTCLLCTAFHLGCTCLINTNSSYYTILLRLHPWRMWWGRIQSSCCFLQTRFRFQKAARTGPNIFPGSAFFFLFLLVLATAVPLLGRQGGCSWNVQRPISLWSPMMEFIRVTSYLDLRPWDFVPNFVWTGLRRLEPVCLSLWLTFPSLLSAFVYFLSLNTVVGFINQPGLP